MITGFAYRVRTRLLVSLTLASAAILATSPLSSQQPKAPALTWPERFTAEASDAPQWVAHVIESPGLRIQLRLPPAWTVLRTDSSTDLVAIDVISGYRLEIVETKPTTFSYDQPVSAERLKASIETMQAAVPKGYVVEKAGQVRAGNQLWLWHESRIPTFGVSASELFKELLRFFQFGSALSWSFTATPEKQLVRVYCAVLYPRGASVSEIDDQTRKAGAVFRTVIERMNFGAR